MARPLEQAVAAIVCTFQEYSGRCGDKHKLCQAELKELLQKELPTWTPVSTQGCTLSRWGAGGAARKGHQDGIPVGATAAALQGFWEAGARAPCRIPNT